MTVCPYLGLVEDQQTPALFSSERNCCYRAVPVAGVDGPHQEAYCLGPDHRKCPVFEPGDKKTPSSANYDFLYQHPFPKKLAILRPLLLIGAFLLFVGLLALGWYYQRRLPTQSHPAGLQSRQPTQTLSETQTAQGVAATSQPNLPLATLTVTLLPAKTLALHPPTLLASLSLESQAAQAPSPSRTPTLASGLETPIGTNPSLLIHRVIQGESLTMLASRYETSPEAIEAVNYFLPVPLWENWILVIPLRQMDVSGLPFFEPYQIEQSELSAENLAEIVKVDTTLLKRYNDLTDNEVLAVGRWILLPRLERP